MKLFNLITTCALMIVFGVGLFYSGYFTAKETIKPDTIVINTESTTTVTVTERVYDFKPFDSLEQLEAWANENRIMPTPERHDWNCVDYALELQARALEDGLIISYESIPDSDYTFYFGENTHRLDKGDHAICSAFIEPVMYLICPIKGKVAQKWDRGD